MMHLNDLLDQHMKKFQRLKKECTNHLFEKDLTINKIDSKLLIENSKSSIFNTLDSMNKRLDGSFSSDNQSRIKLEEEDLSINRTASNYEQIKVINTNSFTINNSMKKEKEKEKDSIKLDLLEDIWINCTIVKNDNLNQLIDDFLTTS